jgi:hypothetical protein
VSRCFFIPIFDRAAALYAQGKIYEKYKNKKTKRRPPFGERPSVMRGSMQLLASGLRRGDA